MSSLGFSEYAESGVLLPITTTTTTTTTTTDLEVVDYIIDEMATGIEP